MDIRIGQGYDIHRLVPKRPLVLGGITVPSERGEDGHSDGDVLIHAVIDALLGALSMGDIGGHFPPGDERFRGISSTLLLEQVNGMVEEKNYRAGNVDTTIILEEPKLKEYKGLIRERLAELLDLSVDRVSVKAKTKEGLDSSGSGEAVEAFAVVLLYPKQETT